MENRSFGAQGVEVDVEAGRPAAGDAMDGSSVLPDYWRAERETVLRVFGMLLASATGDGSAKRQRGEKPPWWRDGTHEAAIFSHLNKWKHGERRDKDSGAHPLVHLAWRALAIAYQETHGQVDPGEGK